MSAEKANFLRNSFADLLKQIPAEVHPHWGKMTVQQMVEHFTDSVRIASGKVARNDLITPEDQLNKMQQFIMSDKPFKENTKNVLMPEIPAPVRNKTIKDAIAELENELSYFFTVFEKNEHLVTRNPFFGDLNYQMNIHLLYKHAKHHLNQFGVEMN
jgi:hypothetical protein